jgi:methane monooxygenase component C
MKQALASVSAQHKVRVTFEGQDAIDLLCREDEDVISAGLRQGILLVSDCRAGSCGACRGFLEAGHYDQLLNHSPHALSERDEEEGWVLACRLRPRSDSCLDFEYPVDRVGRLDQMRRQGRIVALEPLCASVIRVVVRTMAAQAPLHWEAGQYVRIGLVDCDVTRPYSIANAAQGGHDLEFFIALRPGGAFSEAIKAMPGEGAMVTVEGPFGGFMLHDDRRESVFVAGGTGLSPVLAMLRKLAADDPGHPATLIFGVGSEDELFAQNEIGDLTAICPGLKTLLAVDRPGNAWTGLRGTAVDALAEEIVQAPNSRERRYYLSGPAPMVEAAQAVIRRFDIPSSAIHRELFAAQGDSA